MSKTLVIVESPGKIKKINEYLGSEYIVKASIGHVQDLDKKTMSIDTDKSVSQRSFSFHIHVLNL